MIKVKEFDCYYHKSKQQISLKKCQFIHLSQSKKYYLKMENIIQVSIENSQAHQDFINYMKFDLQVLQKVVNKHWGINVVKISELGEDGWQAKSFLLKTNDEKYVLKVQRTEGLDLDHFTMPNEVLQHIQTIGKKDPQNKFQFPRILPLENKYLTAQQEIDGQDYYLRILTFIQGNVANRDIFEIMSASIGELLGIFDRDISTLSVKPYKEVGFGSYQKFAFAGKSLKEATRLLYKECRQYIPDYERTTEQRILLVDKTFKNYQEFFIKNMRKLRTSVIHYDTHAGNLLCRQGCTDIFALIDFGWNLKHDLLIAELGFAIAVIVRKGPPIIKMSKDMVAAYHLAYALTEIQVQCLFHVVLHTLGNYFFDQCWNIENSEELFVFMEIGNQNFADEMKKSCGFH